MGTTFAIFIYCGTIPVSNDLFMMWVMGGTIYEIVSRNNFVEMPSLPQLDFGFSL